MLKACPVLAPALLLGTVLLVSGCGQRGPLYLPTEPAAAQRASLPQTLNPTAPDKAAPATPPATTPP